MKPQFSEIERDALSGKIPMTLEILKKCFTTCIYAGDEREYDNIKERFSELADALGLEKLYLLEPAEGYPLTVYDANQQKFIVKLV